MKPNRLFILILAISLHAALIAQEDAPGANMDEPVAATNFDEMDPLDLYEKQQELQASYDEAQAAVQMAATREEEYQAYISALVAQLPCRGSRTIEDEDTLMELETMKRSAAYLKRVNVKKVTAARTQLDAIESLLTVNHLTGASGKEEIFVSLNIPGRPVEPKRVPLKDELAAILDGEFSKGRKERQSIVNTYKQYLVDVANLQDTALDKMKTNNEALLAQLDADYEMELSIQRAKGDSTKEVEPPPGYEDRHPGKQIADDELKAIPATER